MNDKIKNAEQLFAYMNELQEVINHDQRISPVSFAKLRAQVHQVLDDCGVAGLHLTQVAAHYQFTITLLRLGLAAEVDRQHLLTLCDKVLGKEAVT